MELLGLSTLCSNEMKMGWTQQLQPTPQASESGPGTLDGTLLHVFWGENAPSHAPQTGSSR